MKTTLLFSALLAGSALAQGDGFVWQDEPGRHMDLLHDGTPVVRYVYEVMDPERREETYKPFHHVYDEAGEEFITKGPGGKYTHHRGIYFGFSKVSFELDGTSHNVDTWHARKAYQTHEEVLEQSADAESASHTLKIAWRLDNGTVFAEEHRTLTFTPTDHGLQIDFNSVLHSLADNLKVDGDPQHAGFHFRATNEVSESTAGQTYYIRPETGRGDNGKTINWGKGSDDENPAVTNVPWKVMSFVTGEDRYSVVYLDSPENPKPARYSERDYGRFGSYFVSEVPADSPLEVNYRLVITPGEVEVDLGQQLHDAWLAE